MRDPKWIALFSTIFVLLHGSAPVAVTQSPSGTPAITNVSATADIRTSNCNRADTTPLPGLCQAAPACNGGAGPNPDNIQASVTLCEYNGTLIGRGTGNGFRPGRVYISLIYRNGNTATCSRFRDDVQPTLQNLAQGDSDFASMMLGFWVVTPSGTGTLLVNKQATVSGLQNYGSMSVREIQPPHLIPPPNPAGCFNPMNDPAPQLNGLRACGALTIGPRCGPYPCEVYESLCNILPL